MKHFLTLLAALAIVSSAYTEEQEEIIPIEPTKQITVKEQKPSYKTKYVRAGGILIPSYGSYTLAPNFTAGYLYRENQSGVDFSGNIGIHDKVYTYTLPKVTYVKFYDISPAGAMNVHNLYYGLGGSFYGMGASSMRFHGLAGNLNLGYNARLGKKITNFYQFGINMPAIPISAKGDVYKPSMELNLGLGF